MAMSLADDSTAKQFQKRLAQASQEINQLAPMFGLAKQVIDYDSDRRKNLLAKYARQHIQAGESATAADRLARADPEYLAALDIQAEELRDGLRDHRQMGCAARSLGNWPIVAGSDSGAAPRYARVKQTKSQREWIQRNQDKMRAYRRRWQDKNAERERERRRQKEKAWRAKHPEIYRERIRRTKLKYPEKVRARNTLNNAIQAGKLERQPCALCGKVAQAHHRDYSKPLEVEWLCSVHHGEFERIARATVSLAWT